MKNNFIPITIDNYIKLHLKDNPDEDEHLLRKNLESALDNYKMGIPCKCGNPIWVIGSAISGHSCFTCITGESDPGDDYEIDEAINNDDPEYFDYDINNGEPYVYDENLFTVVSKEYDKSVQTSEKPLFIHEEIELLYHHGLDIDHSILKRILSLPKKTLIEDLEKVVLDSIYRFEYFAEKAEKEGLGAEDLTFPIHAILLLGELRSEQSLPVVLELLRQVETLLDFWLGDFITDYLFQPVYYLSNKNPQLLRDFLYEPNLFTYARTISSSVVSQIALQEPQRRNEVIEWYKEVIHYFLENINDENIIDSDVIEFIVDDIIEFNGKELIDEIKLLFQNEICMGYICGPLDEVLDEIDTPTAIYKKKLSDIFNRYNELIKLFGDNDDFLDDDFDDWETEIEEDEEADWEYADDSEKVMPFVAPEKIGRNDPCPCGSGKKYKKCCMDKK